MSRERAPQFRSSSIVRSVLRRDQASEAPGLAGRCDAREDDLSSPDAALTLLSTVESPYRASYGHHCLDGLVDLMAEQLIARWQRGERPLIEEFLDRYPELWQRPDAALELLFEELCLRKEFDEPITRAEILMRFPAWRDRIEVLLACHRLMEPAPSAAFRPTPGEMVGDFRVVTELGRGARGCVVLATQPALANRPVVLKLAPAEGHEHLSLARLQHTHIVPLYAVYDDPSQNTRVLCMPYFGSVTLARLLRTLDEIPTAKRTGRDVIEALERAQSSSPIPLAGGGPAFRFLSRASYVQAICWIGACLADALHDAHERGLLHLDLKPSNVLIAADGQPMLLDFHLAREPLARGTFVSGRLGGTPMYMAPEHANALESYTADRAIEIAVDGRADVYSLGLTLYEALGGTIPIRPHTRVRKILELNPRVDAGLADLLERCLADDPNHRYPDAAALAADLRRHMNDLPLQGVPSRGVWTRVRRWRRRRRHAFAPALSLVLIAAAVLLGGLHVTRQVTKAKSARIEARTLVRQHRAEEAIGLLRGHLGVIEELPFSSHLAAALRADLRDAEHARALESLQDVMARVPTPDRIEGLSPAERQYLGERFRKLIERQDDIGKVLNPAPHRPTIVPGGSSHTSASP
jgi:serine/threonine protein kinase